MTLRTQARNSQWEYIKHIEFWVSRDTLNTVKKQPLKWEQTSANHAADTWVCIQNLLYEEFLELNKKKKNQKMGKGLD